MAKPKTIKPFYIARGTRLETRLIYLQMLVDSYEGDFNMAQSPIGLADMQMKLAPEEAILLQYEECCNYIKIWIDEDAYHRFKHIIEMSYL